MCLLATTFAFNTAKAQCTISNVSITPTNVDPNTYELTFNLSYALNVQNGTKYSIVHLWTNVNYLTTPFTALFSIQLQHHNQLEC